LAKELQLLISDTWVERIDAYADADFYRNHLARLHLEDEAELPRATRRELKILTRQLVDAASLATVRESGAASLARLADDLGVSMTSSPSWAKAFLAGGILFLVGMTLLWNLIPLLYDVAAQFLSAEAKPGFWPKNLEFSAQYIISQAAPIYLATGVALGTWLSAASRAQAGNPGRRPRIIDHFDRYTGLFAFTVLGIVLFDVFQGFFDYGAYKTDKAGSFWMFIQSNLPFYLLHSFISLVVCFVLLLYMDSGAEQKRWSTAYTISLLTAGVALASFFYAAAQVRYKFNLTFGPNGADLIILMIVLNVSAAMLAFASAVLCKRQADNPDEPQPPVRGDPPAAPTMPITEVLAHASLAPAVSPRG
jgi:hypothetical protein